MLAGAADAQNATPEDEYRKYLRVDAGLAPLDDNAFGEEIALYSGTLAFRQVDVSLPGNGPTIEVARRFVFNEREARLDFIGRAFGDWELDLPSITTTTANQQNVRGWVVNGGNRGAICSSFGPPPMVQSPPGDPMRHGWEVAAWWSGYQLHVPGGSDQELLRRVPGNPAAPTYGGLLYPIVTRGDWVVGCLPQAANDPTVQAFLAISPDGTRYTLDHLSYRWMPNIERPLGSGGSARLPMSDVLARREGRMLPSHVEDRFGNWIQYHYDGDLVTAVTASDGRHVAIGYEAGTTRIATVTVLPGHALARTWHYRYAPLPHGATLAGITLPDGATWEFNLASLSHDAYVEMTGAGTCNRLANADNAGTLYTGSMVHPSRLSAEFAVTPVRRGRSGLYRNCWAAPSINPLPDAPGTFASQPNAWWSMAVVSRRYWGAGMDERRWGYAYSPSNESWLQDCPGGCASTVWTDVTFPDGHAERNTFSNESSWREGLQLFHETFDGAPGTAVRRAAGTSYVAPDPAVDARAAAFPHPWGSSPQPRINREPVQEKIPVGERVIQQDGDTYVWQATAFDAFARAHAVSRSASTGHAVSERQSFHDHLPLWVIGQPAETVNLTTGEVVEQYLYADGHATLASRFRFGRKVMDYTHAPGGQLSSYTNALGQTTTLDNYKRGIPQSVGFPDGTFTRLDVDDLGQVVAITDQAGATTNYGYDAGGRLSHIVYPEEPGQPSYPRQLVHAYAGSERGIAGPHWKTTIAEGPRVETIHYNAMLRPVLHSAMQADGGLAISTRTAYDWRDLPALRSIAYDGLPDLGAMTVGKRTHRDVLGRPVSEQEDSELGTLTTRHEYHAGTAVRTIDPQGNVTSRWHQALDTPSYQWPIRIEAPEGVTQTIARNSYGEPTVVTQSGGGISESKRYTYDADHRLCRYWEIQRESEVREYDAGGQLSWLASGMPVQGDGCGRVQVGDGEKSRYAYDNMGRVTSVVHPSGTVPSTFTYDARGEVATSRAGDVGWSYGRNRRGQLVEEILQVDGWEWAFGYDYDPAGALAAMRYPDGKRVAFAPDVHGRPTRVGDYVTQAAYAANHALEGFTAPNGLRYSARHNPRGLVESLGYQGPHSALLDLAYTYDGNGNTVTRSTTTLPDWHNARMTYDGLDRLVSQTSDDMGTYRFRYDALGNKLSSDNAQEQEIFHYDANLRLASISSGGSTTHQYAFDRRGNVVQRDNDDFTFDAANRLVAVNRYRTLLYDASGRRVRDEVKGFPVYSAYTSSGKLMWQYDVRTTQATDYLYLGSKLVASAKHSVSTIVGHIEGLSWQGDDATLRGWACSTGFDQSVDVHLYAGSSFVKATRAGLPSEEAIKQPCHAAGSTYRFDIPLSEDERKAHALAPLTVYGISPVENGNHAIAGSGVVEMPPSKLAPAAPTSIAAVRETNDEHDVVRVAWTHDGAVDRSRVEWSHNGAAWQLLGDVPNPPLTFPVTQDGQFRFAARGCNEHGCGYRTVSPSIDIVRVPWRPGAFNVPEGRLMNRVEASWSAIRHAERYEVDGFNHSDGAVWHALYAGTGLQASLAPASSGVHSLRLRGCNANGCGEYVQKDGVDVVVAPRDAPTLHGGGTSHDGNYGLSWNGVKDATRYELQESHDGSSWQVIQDTPAGSWSVIDKDNGNHRYQVRGCNDAGCSEGSNVVSVRVDRLPLQPSTIYFRLIWGGKMEHYDASWPAVRYAATYELMEMPSQLIVYQGPLREVRVETGLAPYQRQYTYKIRACNHIGCSDWFGPR